MSGLKKYRWLVLIFVWAGALGLTYTNYQTIQKIVSQRSEIESLRLDREFWHRNSENISRVMNLQKSLYQEIESLKLAQVSLIDKLNSLMSNSGVSDIKIEPDNKISEEDGTTIQISFNGAPNNGMDVLNRIQRSFSFLSFQKINISHEGNNEMVKFDTSVNYHYRLVTSVAQRGTDQ